MSERIYSHYSPNANVVLFPGSCSDFYREIPDGSVKLVVTSPPYNIGKQYEKKMKISDYLDFQESVIAESVRVLSVDGSICWQVGNHVSNSEIFPLDILLYPVFTKYNLKLRNRIIWHFEHGLHCSKRFSGRYETILWFTKNDDYTFNLDSVRVPQKYPNKKHFKGPNAGQLSCNPLGKNPGDLWIIPNVKNNHVEKTIHPCQFPVELVERLVLSLTNVNDFVLDPFMGVGSSVIAAIKNGRRGLGSELLLEYIDVAKERVSLHYQGLLKTRSINQPVYDPTNSKAYKKIQDIEESNLRLFERKNSYAKAK